MYLQVSSGLIEALVLSICEKEPNYGYNITHSISKYIDISESTLYPVLRRLEKKNFLISFKKTYLGRNRKYYQITDDGKLILDKYKSEWHEFKIQIDSVFDLGENL